MLPRRRARFAEVVGNRQFDLTVILENVHDPHNISAVLRSADSVGLKEIFVLYNEPGLVPEFLELGKRSSAGARKWVDVHFYKDTNACFAHVRKNYQQVWSTHLSESSKDLYELDLTQSTALLFGNERDGITEQSLAHSDGNFLIPQFGMVKSLNISVACAVTLYEAMRQRRDNQQYDSPETEWSAAQQDLMNDYLERHQRVIDPEQVPPAEE